MGRVGDGRVVQGKEHVHWRGGWLAWDAGDMGGEKIRHTVMWDGTTALRSTCNIFKSRARGNNENEQISVFSHLSRTWS